MQDVKFTEVDNSTEKSKKTKKLFMTKCLHCREKEKITLDNGMEYELPYAFVEVPKDKDLLKECKNYVEESNKKYGNERIIKRALINSCPKCGNTITICCKDYVDFYSPKKEKSE